MSIARSLDCTETRDCLPDYVDHELSAADCSAVAAHLATCASCRGELEHASALMRDLRRQVSEIRMPSDARRRLWAMLSEEAARLDAGDDTGTQ